MMQHLDNIIGQARKGADETTLGTLIKTLSIAERCYVALAADRADWLPGTYDALAAWHRLDKDWQREVSRWRGWPEEWVLESTGDNELSLARISMALDAAGVPASQLGGGDAIAERLQHLIEQRDELAVLLDESCSGKAVHHG